MKILKKEEALALSYHSKGRKSVLRTMIERLEIDEALTVNTSEWKGIHSPYYVVNYYAKTSGRTFSQGRLADNKGWVFVRTS
ncbi:MAG: hypothetical protein IPI46_01530 [Bacteroidetes bacterium]|nr:hypothetical protein [Bacteroidota bacterium]